MIAWWRLCGGEILITPIKLTIERKRKKDAVSSFVTVDGIWAHNNSATLRTDNCFVKEHEVHFNFFCVAQPTDAPLVFLAFLSLPYFFFTHFFLSFLPTAWCLWRTSRRTSPSWTTAPPTSRSQRGCSTYWTKLRGPWRSFPRFGSSTPPIMNRASSPPPDRYNPSKPTETWPCRSAFESCH